MHIYDSAKREEVLFVPIKTDKVKIYVCGPTVYDNAHLGHARSALVFDLLRRTFIELGYKVIFVKNFTDIDDKIIKKMDETGQTLNEITSHYINMYKNEMKSIGVKDADLEPKATQSIKEIIDFIEVLLEKKIAYQISNGIYFDTSKDNKYLTLSRMKMDDTKARVEINREKKNQKDFVLWKFSKNKEPSYDASFGTGRPGWHVECSAMIEKHMAYDGSYQIDIHAGGADLFFPHHENEASQTRCKSGQELARYWMHNGFVTINDKKMSKSLENSFFLKDALREYDGEILRFYLLSSHYRANFNFSKEDLLVSKKRLDKLYRLKKRVFEYKKSTLCKEFKKNFLKALSEDLNISKALSLLDLMIAKTNEELDLNPKNKTIKLETNANLKWIESILGIGYQNPYMYFQIGVNQTEKRYIEELINKRAKAKKEKDFKKADFLRETLTCRGVNLMDTANGTQWEKVK